jgi:hypothetical protein
MAFMHAALFQYNFQSLWYYSRSLNLLLQRDGSSKHDFDFDVELGSIQVYRIGQS